MFLLRADDAHGYALMARCDVCNHDIEAEPGAVLASLIGPGSHNGGFGPWTLHPACARKVERKNRGRDERLKTRSLIEALGQLQADLRAAALAPTAGTEGGQ